VSQDFPIKPLKLVQIHVLNSRRGRTRERGGFVGYSISEEPKEERERGEREREEREKREAQ